MCVKLFLERIQTCIKKKIIAMMKKNQFQENHINAIAGLILKILT